MLSDLEQTILVGSAAFFIVSVRGWPLIQINFHLEYVGIQQVLNLNSLLQQPGHDIFKQPGGKEYVLVRDDIVEDRINSQLLVTVQSSRHC